MIRALIDRFKMDTNASFIYFLCATQKDILTALKMMVFQPKHLK